MGKHDKREQREERENKEEMSLAEAKAYRQSLVKPATASLSEEEKREAFRIFWAQAKSQYGKSRDLEEVLWLHLKSTKMDKPEQFEAGITHFGLTKIR